MELEDSRHRAHERVVALLNGIDKPSGGIHLLLDELCRFACLGVLRHGAVFVEHVAVLPAYMQLGDVTGVQYHKQFLIPLLDGEVRYDRLPLGLIYITGERIRGFLIQMHDLLYGVLERFIGAPKALLDLIVPMLGEGFEKVLKDRMGQLYRLRLRGLDFQLFE